MGDAGTLARLLASMMQRRWETAGETRFRPDPAEMRPSRRRLLGPDPEAGEEERAEPPPPVEDAAAAGGAGEMARWHTTCW